MALNTKQNDLLQAFNRAGYLLIPNFFSSELMDKAQHIILKHYGESPDFEHDKAFIQKSATEVIPWFPQLDNEALFDELENDPRLRSLTQTLLGEGWRALYCMTMFSKGGSAGQAWHQDCPPTDARCFNLNRLVYTMDINEQTGGQVVVKPGSHLAGKITTGELHEDFPDQLILSPKKGALLLVHGHAWHRVLPVNKHSRVSTNFRAVPKGVPDNITDICVYRNMLYQFSSRRIIEDRTNTCS